MKLHEAEKQNMEVIISDYFNGYGVSDKDIKALKYYMRIMEPGLEHLSLIDEKLFADAQNIIKEMEE